MFNDLIELRRAFAGVIVKFMACFTVQSYMGTVLKFYQNGNCFDISLFCLGCASKD